MKNLKIQLVKTTAPIIAHAIRVIYADNKADQIEIFNKQTNGEWSELYMSEPVSHECVNDVEHCVREHAHMLELGDMNPSDLTSSTLLTSKAGHKQNKLEFEVLLMNILKSKCLDFTMFTLITAEVLDNLNAPDSVKLFMKTFGLEDLCLYQLTRHDNPIDDRIESPSLSWLQGMVRPTEHTHDLGDLFNVDADMSPKAVIKSIQASNEIMSGKVNWKEELTVFVETKLKESWKDDDSNEELHSFLKENIDKPLSTIFEMAWNRWEEYS